MARLNLEDQFFLDYPAVLEKVPGATRDQVIGNAVRFFRFAQEQHKNGQMVSEKDFERHGFLEALIPMFAERTEDGIKAVGAEKHFDWLLKKAEAGRKGGLMKSDTKLKNLKQYRSTTEAEPNQIEASSSSSSSSSYSNSPSRSNTAIAVAEKSAPTISATPFNAKDVATVLSRIPAENKSRWFQLYDEDGDWIQRELLKGVGYYFDNPKKKPKSMRGWLTALSSWLERGWSYRAKEVRGEKSESAQQDDILKIIKGGSDVAY